MTNELASFVAANARKVENAVKDEYNSRFEYFGLKSIYDLHLLTYPEHVIDAADGLSQTRLTALKYASC